MSPNQEPIQAGIVGPELVPVRFHFTNPDATAVSVVGTFNDWNPDANPLHPVGNGRWLADAALPPGNYEYQFLVDGLCLPDPKAPEIQPNSLGGRNSILKVARSPEAEHLADAARTPLIITSN